MRRLWLILGLLLLLLLPAFAQATVDWNDGFEYADNTALQANWSESFPGCTELNISTTRAFAGSKSLQENFTGDGHGNSTTSCFMDRNLGGPGSTIWHRYYIYLESNFQVDAVSTKMVLDGNPNFYPSFWWVMCGPTGCGGSAPGLPGVLYNETQEVATGDGTTFTNNNISGGVIPTQQWVCVETRITSSSAGGADGIVQAWVNGTQVMNITNQRMINTTTIGNHTNNPSTLFTFTRLYTQHGIGTIYYDEFAVSRDARIGGTLCGGGVTDTTPPSQVTGAAAQGTTNTTATISSNGATDSGSGIGGYRYELCAGNGCTNFALWATTGNVLTTTLTGLTANTVYMGRVNAQDLATPPNLGAYSATFTFTTTNIATVTRTTDATDIFNRNNENPLAGGGNWTSGYTLPGGNLQIVSNAVVNTTEDDSLGVYTGAWANDQWCQITLAAVPGGLSGGGCVVRAQAAPNSQFYTCDARAGGSFTSQLRRYDSGGAKTIISSSNAETWVAGDVLLCEIQGTAISMSKNGVQILSGTDATYASGKPGIFAQLNMTFDNFTAGHYGVTPLPVITNAVCNTTGCTLTAGATTPSFVRVQTTGTGGTNIVYTWNDGVIMVAGVFTQPGGGWAAGLTNVSFTAQDGNHAETGIAGDTVSRSLAGLTLPSDVTPPVLSGCAPSGTISQTQTTQTISCNSDELADLRYATSDAAYTAMTNAMTTIDGLHHSAQVPVSNGNTYNFYARGADRQTIPNLDTSSQHIQFTVSNADTTAPTAATNLLCTAFSSSQGTCSFTPGTDGTGVTGNQAKIGISSGGTCTPNTIINPLWGTSSPQQLVNLSGSVTYCVKMNPFDAAGNLAPDSNISMFTTPPLGDPIPPSNVTGCSGTTILFNSVTLVCAPATDNVGVQSYSWYRCEVGVDCPNFIVKFSTVGPILQDSSLTLKPMTHYNYIVFANDFASPTNVSLQPSATIDVTTPAIPSTLTQGLCKCPRKGR